MPRRRRPNGVRWHSQAVALPCMYADRHPWRFCSALDYPPFFAYFEYILSIPASLIDPKIVDLKNLRYDAWSVIAYQRTTVIITELVLGAALLRYSCTSLVLYVYLSLIPGLSRFIRGAVDPSAQRIISISLFLHPGFLIVDHIHFQYNGFMFGILLWSILAARNVRRLLTFQ
jgi:alpha-1,3-glucosyltransferase